MSELDVLDEEDVPSAPGLGSLVSDVRIEQLFGRYDYELSVPAAARTKRLLLLYGDNGTGKTTVLRLIWHLLSPARNRRHRTAVSEIPFRRVELCLADGHTITASRSLATTGAYSLRLSLSGEVISEAEWPGESPFDDWSDEALEDLEAQVADEARSPIHNEIGQRAYLKFLETLAARPYFLADDRNIYSDDITAGEGRVRRDSLRPRSSIGEDEGSTVAQEVDAAMARAGSYLTRLAVGGTATGSRGANSVYVDLLRQLGAASTLSDTGAESRDRLLAAVADLGQRHVDYQELGLVPRFPTDDFISGVRDLPEDRLNLAEEVLTPFLQSLEARLDGLRDAERVIRTFLTEGNRFLRDKELHFRPQRGVAVRTTPDGSPLRSVQLSSGERHLTLLLCNAVLARRDTRVFLVDEPELSLNVKWQRQVVRALLACTDGSPVQFVMATHSLELLSEYQDCVVRLQASTA